MVRMDYHRAHSAWCRAARSLLAAMPACDLRRDIRGNLGGNRKVKIPHAAVSELLRVRATSDEASRVHGNRAAAKRLGNRVQLGETPRKISPGSPFG
jgi:hypothetical protein